MKYTKLLLCLASAALLTGALASCTPKKTPTSEESEPESSESESASSEPESSEPASESSESESASESSEEPPVEKVYTYKTYTAVSPSNWNELTYQDNNDTQIMSFIGGSFFTFNYKFDEEGKILDGEYAVEFDGASKLEDVTAAYAGDAKYAVPEDATSGYAYKITLRDDLKWDDGTEIHAKDFVYTMKEQLNPLFLNFRADSFYNSSTVINKARDYVLQGQSGYFEAKSTYGGVYSEELDSNLVFHCTIDANLYDGANSYIVNYLSDDYGSYISARGIQWLLGALWGGVFTEGAFDTLEGKTLAEIKADDDLNDLWEEIIGWWQTEPGEELDFFVTNYTYPEVDFNDVGIFVGENENELVIVLDKYLDLLKEDGSLSYKAAYNFASLPLVKEDLYEACKVEPINEEALWTSNYNSSVATSASWGPYKLSEFQAGKYYLLERNENWYGYNMSEYAGQYQTDRIECETIAEYNTALLKFLQGDLGDIGIDVSVADTYKNSERAIFQADDFVGSLQLQSVQEALKGRETEGVDKEMLLYKKFRQAISLSINRSDYANKTTTSSLSGLGLFNSMHYYDVANGGAYRNTDQAKQVICDVYGIDVEEYASLDEAYAAAIASNGYNPVLAKTLVDEAYDEALEAGTISGTDKVVLVVGTSTDNESTRRVYNYLNNAFKEMAVGTKLEGRIELTFDASFGSSWANDFRDGAYDICTGGWTGAPWDPGYFLLAYIDEDYRYAQGWDTTKEMMTFDLDGEGTEFEEETMSIHDWWDCLNGISGAKYNWSEGAIDVELRLNLIAALEKEVLLTYFAVPLTYRFSASLLSYKHDYGSKNYNTFMGFGGIRYMTYNYDDATWETVKGTFDYTK